MRAETLRRRAPWIVALATAATVWAIVWLRIARDGVQPYGTNSAQYIEHMARLQLIEHLQNFGKKNWWQFLVDQDAAFPALLHMLTLPLNRVMGFGAEASARTSIFWLLLLAGSVGLCTGLLSRKRELGAVAFTATLLVPSFHGMATRYYFDLPMTALLWLMVATILATRGRRLWVPGGLLAGGIFFAACVVKWAALPLGVILAVAALTTPRADRTDGFRTAPLRRVAMGLLFGLVPALLIWKYMSMVDGVSSFGHQAHITLPVARDTSLANPGIGATEALAAAVRARLDLIELRGLVFYPVHLVVSVLSPPLAAALAALTVVWVRIGRPLAWFVAAIVGGQIAFFIVAVPVQDDRFLVVAVPALVMAGVLAWSKAPEPWRNRAAWGVPLLGLVLALDFHFAPATPLTFSVELMDAADEQTTATVWRGVGLASSTEQRGWARHDDQIPSRSEFRELLFSKVSSCHAQCLATRRGRGVIEEDGDKGWWRYRSTLRRTRTGPEVSTAVIVSTCPGSGEDEQPWAVCEPELIVERLEAGASPWLPRCVESLDWEVAMEVEAPDGGMGASIWKRVGSEACSAP